MTEPPKTIETNCPCCEQPAIFEFVFTWTDMIPGISLEMYNCNKCHTTRELQSLMGNDVSSIATTKGENNA